MTMPTPSTDFSQLGKLIGEYPGKKNYVWIVVPIVALVIAIFGALGPLEFDGYWRFLFGVIAITVPVRLYYEMTAHVDVFERGFRFSTMLKTTEVRWEAIATIGRQNSRYYLYGVIPLFPSGTHRYVIALKGGQMVIISSSTISDVDQLVDSIARRWRESKQAASPENQGAS